MPAFEELGICPELLRVLEEEEWFLPTDVQDEAIPLILGGGDVLAAAETGSGKTGAFVLPILQMIHEKWKSCQVVALDNKKTKVELNPYDRDPFLILDPTGLRCQVPLEAKIWAGGRG